MHRNSQLLFEKYAAAERFRAGMRVLEIGPDAFPSSYRRAVAAPDLAWETLDIRATNYHPDLSQLTYVSDSETRFPLAEESFDVVLSGQVIEHVRKPWLWLCELSRICKPGGTVITICPVSWPYHETPVDCWRMYPEGLRALYEEAGLTVEIAVCEGLEPPRSARALKWLLARQTLKAFLGREPFLSPALAHLAVTLDSLVIGSKR